MMIQNFMRSGYFKSLTALLVVLVLPACSEISEENAAPSIPSAIGAVTITWARPVTREDGTGLPVVQISGYRVYYGAVSGDYQRDVDVLSDGTGNGLVTVDNIPLGTTFYYVVTTYDTEGRESLYSPEDSIPI